MEEPRARGAGTSRRGRVALGAGAASIIGVVVTVVGLTLEDGGLLTLLGFAVMFVATTLALIAGIGSVSQRQERRSAVVALGLTLPALVVLGLALLFVVLVLTGALELN